MKCRRVEILAAVVLFLCACPAFGLIEFKDGLTHDIDYLINDDVWVDYESPGLETTLNILDGVIIPFDYHVEGFEDSIINILGGSIYRLYAHRNSQVAVSGGSIYSRLYAYGSSQVTVSGGSMSYLYAYNSSQVTVSGGSVGYYLNAYDSSQVTISGGSVDYLSAHDSSQVTVSDGSVYDILAFDSSQVTVSGGSMVYLEAFDRSQVTVSGGSMYGLIAYEGSQVTVSGGSVDYLSAHDSSQVTVSGGSMDGLVAFGSSQFTVSGGSIGGELIADFEGILTIHGWDFAVDGMPVGYTELYSIFGGSPWDEPHRQLTGTLLSGDPINNQFRIGNNGKIVLVPEPASAVILGLGGFFLVLRRRRRQA